MSLQLGANRTAYEMLAGGGGGDGLPGDGAARSGLGFLPGTTWETGRMSNQDFALSVQQMQTARENAAEPQNPAQQPVRYALDGLMPLIDAKVGEGAPPLPRWQQTEYSVDIAPAEGEATGEQDDLLDGLLRRLETNSRRYPQNLTGGE